MASYSWLRARYKVKIFESTKELKTGIWVPISVASYISGYSKQNLRMLCFRGFIESGKFPIGPILVNIKSVEGYKKASK